MVVGRWRKLKSNIDDIEMLLDLAREESDEQTIEDVEKDLESLKASVRDEELKLMLGSPQDAMNSIMTIHAGAGGTEAQDWA